jgi:hypothetical protein
MPMWKKRQYVEKRLGLRINLTFLITEEELLVLRNAYSLYEQVLYSDLQRSRRNPLAPVRSERERIDALFNHEPVRGTKWKRWKDESGQWHFQLRLN